MDISERAFETQIVEYLRERHSYRVRANADYDPVLCLDQGLLLEFITATQPETWQALKQQHGAAVTHKFLDRLAHEVERRGTLDVLRRGIKDSGCYFDLAYFAPVSTLNPRHWALYGKNVFAVLRQMHFSRQTGRSIDLVLFLNGLPIVTVELKHNLTGRRVSEAVEQYRTRRDPKGEPLLQFKRCLVHFAVDDDSVAMATRLDGARTQFLPFNRAYDGHAGNPPNPHGYASAYLWEDIWSPESLLELVGQFVHLELPDYGQRAEKLIFPRYHQREVVRALVEHARAHGAGQTYLIQHSAGSGKSNSIAWLAHRLASLHDARDRRVFNTVIVVSDRRVLDRQLQNTMRQFEQTPGVVKVIDKQSDQLAEALSEGSDIIVTTLQKFPYVVGKVGSLAGRRFAIIIDEAHSSQSGEDSADLKRVLRVDSLEAAERAEATAGATSEDLINQSMAARGRQPNLSFFAFTATPKQKTLELFGTPRDDGGYAPFHSYTMQQAIEEGFILDVLQNYITFDTYFNLAPTIADDPRYEKSRAIRLLKEHVDRHNFTIAQKTALMVEHFWEHTRHKIPNERGEGTAKAMVVTRSRLHAVRYKRAFDTYLKRRGYSVKALVAFSGEVDDDGLIYSEAQLNGFAESQTAEIFKKPDYRFLIVAEKFQTGFDQPLLHTMYVDKSLKGVAAVQTLSRLNRVHPRKTETMVLDFVNSTDDIQAAFELYCATTILREGTNPNKLYDVQDALSRYDLYSEAEVTAIAELFLAKGEKAQQLQPLLAAIVQRYRAIGETEHRVSFKHELSSYVRLYAFLSQIISFKDPALERLYLFVRLLLRKLPAEQERLLIGIQDYVDLESYRISQRSVAHITLRRGNSVLDPLADLESRQTSDMEEAALSVIIAEINQRFGTNFTDADKVFFAELKTRLATNPNLRASAKVNVRDNVQLLHDALFNMVLQTMIDSNFEMFKRINDDETFGNTVRTLVFEQVYQEIVRELKHEQSPTA